MWVGVLMVHVEEAAQPRRRIRWFVLLAALIAATVAGAIGILLGDEVLPRDVLDARAPPFEVVFEYSLAAAVGVAAALLSWFVFYVVIFRRRAGIWKSLLALLIIVLIAVCVSVPARIGTLLTHIYEDEGIVLDHQQTGIERRRALRASMAPDITGLRMDQGWLEVHSVAEMRDYRERMDAARAQMESYRQAGNDDLEQSREELHELDVHPNERDKGDAYYEERLHPTSNTQRHLELTIQLLRQGVELLDYLLAHQRGWVIEEGSVTVTDRAVFEELRRRSGELDYFGRRPKQRAGCNGERSRRIAACRHRHRGSRSLALATWARDFGKRISLVFLRVEFAGIEFDFEAMRGAYVGGRRARGGRFADEPSDITLAPGFARLEGRCSHWRGRRGAFVVRLRERRCRGAGDEECGGNEIAHRRDPSTDQRCVRATVPLFPA